MPDIEKQIWDICNDVYKKGVNLETTFTKYWHYYLGKYDDLNKQKEAEDLQNACNVIKQIVETKSTLALDNMLQTSVMPKVGSMEDLKTMKDCRIKADVLNDALKSAMRINKVEALKKTAMRDGNIFGMGVVETVWDPDMGKFGDVKVTDIDPRMCRWDKAATNIEKTSFFSVDMELSPFELKKKYGIKEDGTLDQKRIDMINEMAKITVKKKEEGRQKGVISYDNTAGGGAAFVKDEGGMYGLGKTIKLVKLYFKDDSIFTPEETDDTKEKDLKEVLRFAYPNGRCIIFSPDEKFQTIFEDKAIDYPFGFPIDIFNPLDIRAMEGKGEVEDLIYIQNRIARAYERIKYLIGNFISTICVDKGLDVDLDSNSWVNNPVQFIEGLATRQTAPTVITNNTISEIKTLWEHVEHLKRDALEVSRLNSTMVSGTRQEGTTSGKQVEALKEDPQSSIRDIQRSFRDFMISVSNKVLTLIKNNYDMNRFIMLSTSVTVDKVQKTIGQQDQTSQVDASYASINNGQVTLFDEAGQAIKEIKMTDDMDYEVEIVAGTEIPRSRTETAMISDKLFNEGTLGNKGDVDVIEEYLRSQDFPNYRVFVNLMRKNMQTKPPMPPADKLGVTFQYLPPWAQDQWLANNGFEAPVVPEVPSPAEGGVAGSEVPVLPA